MLGLVFGVTSAVLSQADVNVIHVRSGEESVAFRVMVYSGSADDPPGREGVASLTARLLAGDLDVAVDKDTTLFSGSAAKEPLLDLEKRFFTRLLEPAFEDSNLEAARADHLDALESSLLDGLSLARLAFDGFVYRGHPYAHPVNGLLGGREAVDREDLLAFHREHYRKGNLLVGLAGDVDGTDLTRVRNELATLPDGAPSRSPRPVSYLVRPRVAVIQTGRPGTAHLRIGHPLTVTRAHPAYFPLRAASTMLQADGGLPPGARVSIEETARRREAFLVQVDVDPTAAAGAVRTILRGIRKLVNDGPPPAGGPEGPATAGSSTAEDELAGRMREFLDRTVGVPARSEASLREQPGDAFATITRQHIHPDRVAIVAVVPDAEDFVSRLLLEKPTDGPAISRSDIEIVDIRALLEGR